MIRKESFKIDNLVGYFLFILIFLSMIIPLYLIGLKDEHFLFIVIIISFVLLPFVDYYFYKIKLVNKDLAAEIDIETIDSILEVESIDDFLDNRFDAILKILSVKNGMMIFYEQDLDRYKVFRHNNENKEVFYNKIIDGSKFFLKVINSSDDLIIRSKLNKSINFEKRLFDELNEIDAEIVIPIYYQEKFLGLMTIGGRKANFSSEEVKALKIFALRISGLWMNSFFINQIVKKKELEKEHALARKIQKRFLPKKEIKYKTIDANIYFNKAFTEGEKIYDIFKYNDEIRITAYGLRQKEDNPIILLPAVKVLLQTYSRLNFDVKKSVQQMLDTVKYRGLIDEDLDIIHISIKPDGSLQYYLVNYACPYIFNEGKLVKLESSKKYQNKNIKNSLIIFCSYDFSKIIDNEFQKVQLFLQETKNFDINVIRKYFSNMFDSKEDEHVFFSLIKVGDVNA